jgi:hypothetical protein
MTKTHEVSIARQAEFEQKPNEDVHQWIARQIDMATPFEATWLYLLRSGDEKQRAAWEFHQAATSARWSRVSIRIAVIGTIVNTALAIVAIVVS